MQRTYDVYIFPSFFFFQLKMMQKLIWHFIFDSGLLKNVKKVLQNSWHKNLITIDLSLQKIHRTDANQYTLHHPLQSLDSIRSWVTSRMISLYERSSEQKQTNRMLLPKGENRWSFNYFLFYERSMLRYLNFLRIFCI